MELNKLGLSKEDMERLVVQSSIDQMKNHEARIRLSTLDEVIKEVEEMEKIVFMELTGLRLDSRPIGGEQVALEKHMDLKYWYFFRDKLYSVKQIINKMKEKV